MKDIIFLEELGANGRIRLQRIVKECWRNLSAPEKGKLVGCCEHEYEPYDSINAVNILDYVKSY